MDPNGRRRRISVDVVEGGAMRRLALVPFLVLAAGAVAAVGAAAGGGPTPGTVAGWDGALAPGGAVRYVALPADRSTAVAAVRVADGRVLRYATLQGAYGVPVVAFDGSSEGVSADGKALVLAGPAVPPSARAMSHFAVLSTRTLRPRRIVALRGSFTYDALSPDATTAYLVEYLSGDWSRYRVRALDLASGRLVPGAIVAKSEANEAMQGAPVTRQTSRDRGWAFTLYARSTEHAFVHALDTRHRSAVCVDLPWRIDLSMGVRMSTTADGTALVLHQPATGTLATIDTASFRVTALRKPVAPGSPVP
jgi:hypothetical protein